MATSVPFVQVDAFTDQPFSGNPAAVCLLDAPLDDAWYQAVAAEMNLSETAFVVPDGEHWSLRWFTPTMEIDLCGHATLATAHVLWTSGTAQGPLQFATRSGVLRADQDGPAIRLDFPSRVPTSRAAAPGLLEGLGATDARWTGADGGIWLVELADPAAVANLRPDFAALRNVDHEAVVVTAPGGRDADFVCRVFGPRVGIDEDPVTGAAHCLLGPYWASRLGARRLRSHQISRRGGRVEVEVHGARVALFGHAVTVAEGTILALTL